MEVEELTLTRELADAEVKALKQAVRQNAKLAKEQLFKDQMKVYGFFNKHGGKLIDIWQSFQKAGLNADGDPKLAICRADAKECFCQKHEDGSAIFTVDRTVNYWDQPRKTLSLFQTLSDLTRDLFNHPFSRTQPHLVHFPKLLRNTMRTQNQTHPTPHSL